MKPLPTVTVVDSEKTALVHSIFQWIPIISSDVFVTYIAGGDFQDRLEVQTLKIPQNP